MLPPLRQIILLYIVGTLCDTVPRNAGLKGGELTEGQALRSIRLFYAT